MSIGETSGKMIMRVDEWRKGINSATMTLRTHSRKVKEILFESKTATEKYSMKLAELNAMSKKFGLTQREVAFQTARLKEQFLGIVPAATRASRAMAGVKSMAMAYAGPTALVFGGVMAGRRAEGIRQDMQSSLAIMGDVSDQMKAVMRETASVVAADTKFSTAEASKAYYFLASAGMDAAESIGALPTVSKFAQSGMFDLSRATDLLTDAQMALGMSSEIVSANMENMTRVGDVLVGANTIANASVEQFAEALTTKAAAAARMVSKDIEETVAWLAVFANQGLKGAAAGTAFSIVLRDLQTKGIKNSAAFAELGIAVYDSSGKMKNLAAIIGDMERAMEGMSDKAEKAALIQLGMSDKSVAYTQMLIGMAKAGRDLEEQLDSMGGKMGEVAGKQLTDFAKGWERIKAVWDKMATGPIGAMLDKLGTTMQLMTGNLAGAMGDADKQPKGVGPDLKRGAEGFFGKTAVGWMQSLADSAAFGFADIDAQVSREAKREAVLSKAVAKVHQGALDAAKKQQDFEARMATKAGLAQSWLTQQGRGFAAGGGDLLGMLGRAGKQTGWGIGQVAAGQQWDIDLARKAREARAKEESKALKKAETKAMDMLRGAGTDGAALRFASADVYGSQAAISAIARAQAPGLGKRSLEDLTADVLKEVRRSRELTAEMLPYARRIAKEMPVEMDVPP